MTTLVQARVTSEDKIKATRILRRMGLNMSSAIKVFLRAVVIKKGIPFEIRDEDGFTPAKKTELLIALRGVGQNKNLIGPLRGKKLNAYLKNLS